MTQEEIELLFKDLCARLPYGVKVTFAGYSGRKDCTLHVQHLNSTYNIVYLCMKPYLRPMSSMTEEEKKQYQVLTPIVEVVFEDDASRLVDWLNAHHFDYRGLIEQGLALEAPKDMYNTKTE